MGEFQAYPSCRHHLTGKTTTVKNQKEDDALGGGWARSLAELAPYQGPRRAGPQYDPVKWLDQWLVGRLTQDQRKKIEAQLRRVHGAFWKSPDAPNAATDAMRSAFDRVAHVLFDAELLSQHHLATDIPQLVWDSAMAGGWWHLASETPQNLFPEELGHYWVWRDTSRDWNMLFTSEASEWQARLLEGPAPVLDPAQPPKARTRGKSAELPSGPTASARAGARRWEDVKITFLSAVLIQIWIAGEPRALNYSEMGFTDRRNGTPGRSWFILRHLAQNQGVISAKLRGTKGWAATEKQVERTRKLLQSHFGISEDPLPFEKGTGYRLRCEIECAPSFDV